MPNLDGLIKTIKESQKTLFILCGLPYAGKSFIAEELRKNTDVVYVSIDAIFRTHGFDWDTNKLPNAEEWQKIFDESYEKTKQALMEGKSVLYDSTNHSLKSRELLRNISSEVGGNAVTIFINITINTIWKRWEANSKSKTRPVVSRKLVKATIEAFETPQNSENMIEILND
jgi:predicted kinase